MHAQVLANKSLSVWGQVPGLTPCTAESLFQAFVEKDFQVCSTARLLTGQAQTLQPQAGTVHWAVAGQLLQEFYSAVHSKEKLQDTGNCESVRAQQE